MSKPEMIYFKPDEVKALQMACENVMEMFKENQEQPWQPHARKTAAEIMDATRRALRKLEKVTGVTGGLPPFEAKDWDEFFTKPS